MSIRKTKPTKGEFGFLFGTCERCSETEFPLVKFNKETVCPPCADTLKRAEAAKKKMLRVDKDDEFVDRVLSE